MLAAFAVVAVPHTGRAPAHADAAAAYVATTGSDSNPCAQTAPCLTFNRAYRVAQPGQTVEVAAGTYPGQTISPDPAKAGATSAVIFQPAAGASVSVAGGDINTGFVEWRGLAVTDGLSIEPASSSAPPSAVTNVTLRGLTMESLFVYGNSNLVTGGSVGGFNACDRSNQEDGIELWMRNGIGTTGNTIDGVVLHDISIEQFEPGSNVCGSLNRHADCIQILSGHDETIEHSTFYNCPTSDIIARPFRDSLTNITIEDNFLGQIAHPGQNLSIGTTSPPDPCGPIQILYNTSLGGGVGGGCTPNAVTVKGNILRVGSCSAGYTFSHNVFVSGSTVCGSNAFRCNPAFVVPNSATSDFHLSPTDTCARDRGDPTDFPPTDHDRNARALGSGPDIGADEAVAGPVAGWVPPRATRKAGCHARRGLPDRRCTPGDVRQSLDLTAICGRVLPAPRISAATANAVYRAYGLKRRSRPVDLLVPASLGGTTSRANLWPAAALSKAQATRKRAVEQRLRVRVCSGSLALAAAQRAIATSWPAAR